MSPTTSVAMGKGTKVIDLMTSSKRVIKKAVVVFFENFYGSFFNSFTAVFFLIVYVFEVC